MGKPTCDADHNHGSHGKPSNNHQKGGKGGDKNNKWKVDVKAGAKVILPGREQHHQF